MEPIYFLKNLKSFLNSFKRPPMRGFTILEMTVVLAIIVILTAVILVSQNDFNRTLLLTNTTYTVALSIRESQTLGLSTTKSLGVQNAAVGLHFPSGSSSSYMQFADTIGNPTYGNQAGALTPPSWCPVGTANTPSSKPGNCVYDGASELLHTYTFNQQFNENFCVYHNVGSTETVIGCSNAGPAQMQSLDIVFQRPNTDTVITSTLTSGVYSLQPDLACIQISSPSGGSDYVKVSQLGEVAVSNSCP